MPKQTHHYFTYPPNIHSLDLATLVTMYRSRGKPVKAPAGDYYGCALTGELLREAKSWFGRAYSQQAWDMLLTRDSQGYPLTQVELNILGMALHPPEEEADRSYIEQHCGTLPQLAFLIVNDLKQFGFLQEDGQSRLMLTEQGVGALQGIALRIHNQKFHPDMLHIHRKKEVAPSISTARKRESSQFDLF